MMQQMLMRSSLISVGKCYGGMMSANRISRTSQTSTRTRYLTIRSGDGRERTERESSTGLNASFYSPLGVCVDLGNYAAWPLLSEPTIDNRSGREKFASSRAHQDQLSDLLAVAQWTPQLVTHFAFNFVPDTTLLHAQRRVVTNLWKGHLEARCLRVSHL